MFYSACVRVEYREEPCKTALNRVKGMPFAWSLNPYMGCVHRCTFCYVRAFERRADRPSGEAYGVSIRVKVNIADVLRRELARKSWRGESIAIGAATDPYQPAEGRYRLTRGCLEALASRGEPVPHRHPRAADRARRRRARGGGRPCARERELLGADARRGRVAAHRARDGAAAPAAARALGAPRGGSRSGRRGRTCPAGHLGRAAAAAGGRARRPAKPARRTSGQASSTSGRGRASTFSPISPRTGPSSRRSTSGSTASARIRPARSSSACAISSRRRARSGRSLAADG